MVARKSKTRLFVCLALVLVICAAVLFAASGINLPEASGKKVKKDGKMTVDCSNQSEGYIMVKGNSDGEYEVFPLQFGSGKYQVSLFENASGKKYSKEGSVKLSVEMPDELRCFLYPNQYVSFDENTACVKYATEMCKDMTDQADIYKAVCNYVTGNFVYDFIKSVTVKPGQLPQIDECWENKMGICQDLSAMTCAMLRSQGVPARLMIGTVGSNTYHAWVVAVVNGEDRFFDPTAELNASSKTETYTTERYY